MSTKTRSDGDPIATPFTCLLYLLLNLKKYSLVTMLRKLQKIMIWDVRGILVVSVQVSTQISMISSQGIFVNKKSRSRLVMRKLESC